ncbi:MAG: D-aminoacylase [Chloroflexi bacterium]|nr:D-aminoacylase [Chloroflexota bacterium]MCL5109329.1 D-aminoacylase [Chloroflexota bacterium]
MFDLLIAGGLVYDGQGGTPYRADVGVVGERIVALGRLGEREAVRTISAGGQAVCPGFIDMHSHADLAVLTEPLAPAKVRQGVTTQLVGQCGLGPAPTTVESAGPWRQTLAGVLGDQPSEWPWRTFASYLDYLARARPALNVATLATFGAIRSAVLGLDDRSPDDRQLAAMAGYVDEALATGAYGLSVGLVYLPCFFAEREELVAVYRRVAAGRALMDIHIRDQADGVLGALREAVTVADSAGVSLHVSHLCAAGPRNWGKPQQMLALIDAARARGQDVTFDQHPYEAGSTLLSQVLPAWSVAGGNQALTARLADPQIRQRIKREIAENPPASDPRMPWQNYVDLVGWGNVLIAGTRSERNRACLGHTVSEIAAERGCEPADAALDLLLAEEGQVAMVLLNLYSPADLALIIKHPAGMIGSDDVYVGNPHPRLYGTFPRVLGKFARDDGALPLAAAIQRLTSAPASRLGLRDRGVLREGAFADIVVFDPASVRDRATYAEPRQFPEGIFFVAVNGQIAVEEGRQTEARAGHLLRRD